MSQNMEINNSVYTSSIDPSLFQSVTDQAQLNSIIKNMTTDTLDRPIKYSKPKYLEVEKTYKELAPITNETIQMPTKHSNKIRTVDTVYQQPIVLGENASLSVIFKGNEYEQNIPIPTNSVINNLMKDSVMQSSYGQDFQPNYNQDIQSNIQPPIQSNIQPPIQSNIQSQMQLNIQPQKQSNIQSQMQSNIQSQMQSNIQSQMQSNIHSQVKSNIKPEIQSNIQSQMQSQRSKYKSKIGRTKYEEELLREDEMKSIKQSSGIKSSNNQKISAIPPPEVHEGVGLVFSTQFDNNNMKSTMNNINNTNMLNSQQSQHNQSKLSSKISQANNPQYQQSIHSTKYFPQSTHQTQMQMQQSNINNQTMKQSNVPPRQSGVHQSSANNSIKSNQFQQSTQLSKKSNIPPTSQIQSQMQQSNINNKYSQSSTKNSLPSYHQSQFKNSNIPNNNNINNNNYPSTIKKNPIGVYETTMMPSVIQSVNQSSNNNINNQTYPDNTNNIKKNPIGIYETTLMPSTIQSTINNNVYPSVQGSNVGKISTEPKLSEYNLMNNKSTMNKNNNMSFPNQSNLGKNPTKSAYPSNPFKK